MIRDPLHRIRVDLLRQAEVVVLKQRDVTLIQSGCAVELLITFPRGNPREIVHLRPRVKKADKGIPLLRRVADAVQAPAGGQHQDQA